MNPGACIQFFWSKNQEIRIDSGEQESGQALKELQKFIKSNPDPRELKRALVIQMLIKGLKPIKITEILEVSAAFISKWKAYYACVGIEGLKLKHRGSTGYLSDCDRQPIIEWLKSKKQIKLDQLENYIEDSYGVKFRSKTQILIKCLFNIGSNCFPIGNSIQVWNGSITHSLSEVLSGKFKFRQC